MVQLWDHFMMPVLSQPSFVLSQGWGTSGLRAKCGPPWSSYVALKTLPRLHSCMSHSSPVMHFNFLECFLLGRNVIALS